VHLALSASRIATRIDVHPLVDAIAARPHLWALRTLRQDYPGSPHADTQAICLRLPENALTCPRDLQEDLTATATPECAQLWEPLQGVFLPLLRALRVSRLGRAVIVRLPAGGQVAEHVDQGAYAKTYSRFHLVLASTMGFRFSVGEEVHSMAPGECWWFDHRQTHSARNEGPGDRISLIFDVQTPWFTVGGQDEP